MLKGCYVGLASLVFATIYMEVGKAFGVDPDIFISGIAAILCAGLVGAALSRDDS